MRGDSGKLWMLVFYTLCGAFSGIMVGFIILVFLSFWMDDGVAFEILCGIGGGFIGFKVGEKKLL